MRPVRLLAPFTMLALVTLLVAGGGGCKKSDDTTVLQAQDLVPYPDGEFDPNEILDPASFSDTQTLLTVDIETFLLHGPYNRPSFLATYQSNGVRAADAVLASGQKYGINPLVFLVIAQLQQGLVGAQFYPSPTSRVEYAFGCGCGDSGGCDPALAGFDKQVDCLGRQLSMYASQLANGGYTAGGWGEGQSSKTVDGQSVTPADSSTAILYQYDPVVGTGQRGNWLFWNIWQYYAEFLAYAGPIGTSPTLTGGWIGDPCTGDGDCGVPGGFCAINFPGGMCTISCTDSCPTADERPDSFCADFGTEGGFCLAVCNPDNAGSCRDQYSCQSIVELGTGDNKDGCAQAQ